MDILSSLIRPDAGRGQVQSPKQQLLQTIEIAPPELRQQMLQSLAILCNGRESTSSATSRTVDDIPEVSAAGTASQPTKQLEPAPNRRQINLLCAFWYHFGDCRRHPESPTYDGSKDYCRYLHFIDPRETQVMCQILPPDLHRRDCDLSRCPLRNRMTPRDRHREPQSIVGAEIRGRKRDRPDLQEHPDRHGARLMTNPSDQATGFETCFFWYHGDCRRMRDLGGCDHLHALTSPPSMVKPPPGYVHRQVCNLAWCPGDFREKDVDRPGGNNKKQKKYHDHVDNPSALGHEQIMDRLLYSDGDNEVEVEAEVDDDNVSTWFLAGFDII